MTYIIQTNVLRIAMYMYDVDWLCAILVPQNLCWGPLYHSGWSRMAPGMDHSRYSHPLLNS